MSEINLLTQSFDYHAQNSPKTLDNKDMQQLVNEHNRLFFFDKLYCISKHGEEYTINEITLVHDNMYAIKSVSKQINLQWLEKTFLDPGYNWIGPVFDSIQNRRVICKPLPIKIRDKSEPIYIIAVYNVSQIYQYLQNSGLNKFGVAYILDSTSHFLAHPLEETRSLIDLGHDYADKTLTELGHDIVNRSFAGKDYIHINTMTRLNAMK